MEKALSPAIEDYLEAIYIVRRRKGKVRVSDIARLLGVRMASVTQMLRKLAQMGFVEHERYGHIDLTEEGEKVAERVLRRHETLKEFLVILGVDEQIAEEDACKIEHVLHHQTLEKLVEFVEFVRKSPKKPPKWLKHLEEFRRKKKHPCA